jgi:hypothetical protein
LSTWRVLAGVVLALTFAAGFLLARRAVLDRRALASDYGAAARDPGLARRVQLAGFPLRRQAHAYSCGAAKPALSDTHYSVVTGLDLARGFVHIADAYGFEEDVPLPAFFERLALANHWSEPFAHRLARLTGYVAKNHLYVISPSPRRE